MNSIGRTNGFDTMTPAADHSGKEGYFAKIASAKAALCAATTDVPYGVITEGATTAGKDSLALLAGGFKGTVRIKLNDTPGTVIKGSIIAVGSDGTGIVSPGAGTARVECAQSLEIGAAGELIECVLFKPIVGT